MYRKNRATFLLRADNFQLFRSWNLFVTRNLRSVEIVVTPT